jgi:hypothetical protein
MHRLRILYSKFMGVITLDWHTLLGDFPDMSLSDTQ